MKAVVRHIYDGRCPEGHALVLTHWGRVALICVSKFTIIGSHNGLSPIWRPAIIWTNAGILLIWTLGTNFSEIVIQIYTFSNKKMHLKMSSGKCRPFCLDLNELNKCNPIQSLWLLWWFVCACVCVCVCVWRGGGGGVEWILNHQHQILHESNHL